MDRLTLPPWGTMHESFTDEIANAPVPPNWKPSDGTRPTLPAWNQWLDTIVDEIADFLWPRYDPVRQDWIGAAALTAPALDDADFALLERLHGYLDEPICGRSALQQFAVDIGDRRVFAGVHYPSDNISSWYAALRIIPHIFDGQSAATFLWTAITTKSLVYGALLEHIAAHPSSPYRAPLARLRQVAEEVCAVRGQ